MPFRPAVTVALVLGLATALMAAFLEQGLTGRVTPVAQPRLPE